MSLFIVQLRRLKHKYFSQNNGWNNQTTFDSIILLPPLTSTPLTTTITTTSHGDRQMTGWTQYSCAKPWHLWLSIMDVTSIFICKVGSCNADRTVCTISLVCCFIIANAIWRKLSCTNHTVTDVVVVVSSSSSSSPPSSSYYYSSLMKRHDLYFLPLVYWQHWHEIKFCYNYPLLNQINYH